MIASKAISTTAIPTSASAEDWQRLSQMKIVFGHQSVGEQIVSSIDTLAHEHTVVFPIAETREALSAPGLHHFKVGRNGEPQSKLKDFETTMSDNIAGTADVAMMKLCYIDFDQETHPKQLAQDYIAEVERLGARFPQTTFIPITAPLTTVQTGPKALIKKLMGKSPAGYESNARRKVFNETLRAHYAHGNVLFDIAALESRLGKVGIDHDGQHIETMDPALTSDGGHLNDQGKRMMASALVHHLANVTRSKSAGQ